MIRIAACGGGWTGERAAALEGLERAGYAVEIICHGGGPLECVVGPAPDLLLFSAADDSPWHADALRVVRRIHPDLPLVIVTSDGSVETRRRDDALRPAFVAVDPIDARELVEIIENLTGRRSRDAIRPG